MNDSTKASPSEAGNSSKDVQAREKGGLKENVDKRDLQGNEEENSEGKDREKNLDYQSAGEGN
jgi:hypothetical protein